MRLATLGRKNKDGATVLEREKKPLTTEPGVSEVSKDMGVMRKEERKKKKSQQQNAWHHLYTVVWAYKELPGQRA